ncbi:hypothetical protein FQN53_004992 [Emmonsiellopsis sp. PD_33]|nr:hypothetical protein FQN53_004992 [Emmonsiellopsis sp. PD_33]
MASPQNPDPSIPPLPQPVDHSSPQRDPDKPDETTLVQEETTHPPFRPFFTLIQDTNTSEYHHPTVHYIFSDDDTDLITDAALRALETQPSSLRGSSNAHSRHHEEAILEDDAVEGSGEGGREKPSTLPPPVPGVQEHYIVLDVQPAQPSPSAPTPANTGDATTTTTTTTTAVEEPGPTAATSPPTTTTTTGNPLRPAHPYTITSAHSLSPSWQVLNARLRTAPTFDSSSTNSPTKATANDSSSSVGGLMLEIEGTSGIRFDRSPRGQSLEEMMGQFEKRMEELRLVIEAGGQGDGGETVGREAGGEQGQTRGEAEVVNE